MLRKSALLLGVLSLLMVAATAYAAGGWSISVGGGLAVPIGDFSKSPDPNGTTPVGLAGDLGYQVDPSVDYMLNERFSVGVDGSFAGNNIKKDDRDKLRAAFSDPALDVKYTQIGGGVHGAYWLPMQNSPFSAYLLGGVGMTQFKAKVESIDPAGAGDHTKSGFSARAGLGAGYKVAEQWALGLEGEYHFVSIKKDDPNTLGFTYNESSAPSVGVKAVVTFMMKGTEGTK